MQSLHTGCIQRYVSRSQKTSHNERLHTAGILQCPITAKHGTIKKGLAKRHLLQRIYSCADKTKLLAPEQIVLQERRE